MRRENTRKLLAVVRQEVALLPEHEERRYTMPDGAAAIFRRRLSEASFVFLAYFTHRTSECFTTECALSRDGEYPFHQLCLSPRGFPALGRTSDPFDGSTYRFRLVSLWEPQDHWFCAGASAWRTARLPFMDELRALLEKHAPALPETDALFSAEVRCTIKAYQTAALPFLEGLIQATH